MLYCESCGRLLQSSEFYAHKNKDSNNIRLESRCKACSLIKKKIYNMEHPEAYARKLKTDVKCAKHMHDSKLSDFLDDLKAIEPISLLTDNEWYEICNHFRGCALCESSDIERRLFFLPTKIGGTYNRFNVFPACEKHSTIVVNDRGPFDYFLRTIFDNIAHSPGVTKEKNKKLIEYFQNKVKEERARLGK